MKKALYSYWLKIIAIVLFIASITLGALVAANGTIKYDNEGTEQIYQISEDFYNSPQFVRMLNLPEEIVYNSVMDYYTVGEDGALTKDQAIAYRIRKYFNANALSAKINYYVKWNNTVITNCDVQSPQELLQGEYYSFIQRGRNGSIEHRSTHRRTIARIDSLLQHDSSSPIIIACSISPEIIDEYKSLWEKQKSYIMQIIIYTPICIVFALIVLIYLICVCGTNKDGERKNTWLENIWSEVHLIAIAGAVFGAYIVCITMINECYTTGQSNYDYLYWITGATFAVAAAIILTSLLSLVRKIKTKNLLKTSVLPVLLKYVLRWFISVIKWIYHIIEGIAIFMLGLKPKKTVHMFVGIFVAYTALICIATINSSVSLTWFIVGIAVFVFAIITIITRAKDLDEIKKGIDEVQNGNLTYKIPELKCVDTKELAVNFNNISTGLDESLAAQVKAERLKSELITNVSHDLKTPITSIINYGELLLKVEGLPEEARDYAAVISNKGNRLKTLTQDLFDISKVHSGNDEVNLEKLDVALLVEQALAEHDNEIQKSELTFCTNTQKELFVMADGKKMSRVLSNLINNALKYSMKNTRVFVTASQKNDNVEIEIKNISAYPLDFDVNEITQRFVRGDESRSTEGHGLGLAIAKSYTEVCNGTFEIVTDGDMFKAILVFEKCD